VLGAYWCVEETKVSIYATAWEKSRMEESKAEKKRHCGETTEGWAKELGLFILNG